MTNKHCTLCSKCGIIIIENESSNYKKRGNYYETTNIRRFIYGC